MNYRIKVNLGMTDGILLVAIFAILGFFCACIGIAAPVSIVFLVPFYSLMVLIYSIKHILESIQIIEDKDKNEIINSDKVEELRISKSKKEIVPKIDFSETKIEELEKIYDILATEEEKENFLNSLKNNKEIKEREKFFKDLDNSVVEELAKTDIVAKYILKKRKNK